MKRWQTATLAIGLLYVSLLRVIPDPYHHRESVNFWEWCIREFDELLHGEKE